MVNRRFLIQLVDLQRFADALAALGELVGKDKGKATDNYKIIPSF